MLGAPVCKEEFYDREELMRKLKQRIPHAHHALIGPRGCGKSSILLQLSIAEKPRGLTPVYIDIGEVTPKTRRNALRKIGKEVLTTIMRKKGLLRSMPAFLSSKAVALADFVRDTLRVKIGEWITMYFDTDADLTDFMDRTFSTIESYGVELLVMLDEITSVVRFQGPQPKPEDMDFMEALRSHISKAKNARYILSGSQVGLMNMITRAKFGRLLVPEFVGGLEEKGADAMMRKKIPWASEEFREEVKKRTNLWPLYLQAYCIAANLKKTDSIEVVEKLAFELLHGHFKYMESQLGELELMALLALGDGRIKTVARRLQASYYTVLSAFRTLVLKGFLKKTSPGIYAPVDRVFMRWLEGQHEVEVWEGSGG